MGIPVDVNIRGHNQDLLRSLAGSTAALRAFEKESNQLRARQLTEERRAAAESDRQRRSFLAGLAPGGRRATGLAGFAGVLTGGAVGAAPLAGGASDLLAILPALTAGLAPLAGLLPTIGVGAVGAGQGLLVMKSAMSGLSSVIDAQTPKQLAAALNKLDPAAQKAAYAFRKELHPTLERLDALTKKNILPSLFKMGYAFEQLAKPGHAISDGIKATTEGIAHALNSVTKLTENKQFSSALDTLLTNAGHGIGNLANILPPMLDGFVKLSNLATPLTNELTHMFGGWMKDVDSFITTHGPQISHFFDQTFAVVQGLAHQAKTAWDIVTGLSSAASGLASGLGQSLGSTFGHLDHLINSPQGQDALKQFFAEALPTLQSFGGLVGDLLKDLGHLAANPETQVFLKGLFDTLRNTVLPILNDVASALPSILTELAPLRDTLSSFVSESLKPMVDSLIQLVEAAIPPLIPLVQSIAESLKIPLQELTSIVQLLTSALGGLQQLSGGSPIGGLVEALAIGGGVAGYKKAPGLIKKAVGLDAEKELLASAALPEGLLFAALGGADNTGGLSRTKRAVQNRVLTKGAQRVELNAVAGEAAIGANAPMAANDALQYLIGRKAVAREATDITNAFKRSAGGLAPTDPIEAVRVGRRYSVPEGFNGPALFRRGYTLHGAAADFSTYGPAAARVPRGTPYDPINFADVGQSGVVRSGAQNLLNSKFALRAAKMLKVFGYLEVALAGVDAISASLPQGGGFKPVAGLKRLVSDIASPVTSGSAITRIVSGGGLGAAIGSFGGPPGAIIGAGIGAGVGALNLGGSMTGPGANAVKGGIDNINKSLKAWDLTKVVQLANALPKMADGLGSVRDGAEKVKQSVLNSLGNLPQLVRGMNPALVSSILSPFEAASHQVGSILVNMGGAMRQSMQVIASDLGTKSKLGKQAMVAAFTEMQLKVQHAMDTMQVSVKQGNAFLLAEMRSILTAMGFSGVRDVARNITSSAGKQAFKIIQAAGGAKSEGGAQHGTTGATGLYMIGDRHAAGGDNVPMVLNGKPVLAAEGENIAIFNRHQRTALNARLRGDGGLQGFFSKFNKPHYMAGGGFVPGAGTNYSVGDEPEIARRLDRLAHALGINLTGISGYRTPQHSVNVGGFANDPHTRGMASDTPGIERVSEAVLEKFGLTRPFGGAAEADHIQLLGGGGGKGIGGAIAKVLAATLPQVVVDQGGLAGAIAQGAVDKTTQAGNAIIKAAAASVSTSIGSGDTGPGAKGGKFHDYFSDAQVFGEYKREGGPLNLWSLMRAIMHRESGGAADATNVNSNGTIDRGLWQINSSWGKWSTLAFDSLSGSVAAMLHVLRTQGLSAWKSSSNDLVGQYDAGLRHFDSGGVVDETNALPGPPFAPADVPKSVTSPKKKKAKSKKAKKGPRYAKEPGRSAPYGTQFGKVKPRSKWSKKIAAGRVKGARTFIKDLINAPFIETDLQSATDPLTGDPIGDGVGALQWLKPIDNLIKDPDGTIAGMVDVESFKEQLAADALGRDQQTVTLQDYEGGPNELTDYLKGVKGLDDAGVEKWIQDNGDSLEVVNQDGMNEGGVFKRGIKGHVGALSTELGSHQVIRDAWDNVKTMLVERIDGWPEKAIAERRKRLAQLKRIFEANLRVKRAADRKISAMSHGKYGWQEAVSHNDELIKEWRHSLRDGERLPHGYRERVNHIIDRLQNTNDHLKATKPKGDVKHIDQIRDLYDDRAVATAVISTITGSGDSDTWNLNGGGAAKILGSIHQWQAIGDYRDSTLKGATDGANNETLTMQTIQDEINEWLGTNVLVPKGQGGGGTGGTGELDDLLKQQNDDLLRTLALANEQFGVFSGFAPLAAARLVGAFAHGGVVPETGMALVHKGEWIGTDPDGPFRNGMNAGPTIGGDTNLELHLHGDLGRVIHEAILKAEGRIVRRTSETLGRRSRLIASAPGKR